MVAISRKVSQVWLFSFFGALAGPSHLPFLQHREVTATGAFTTSTVSSQRKNVPGSTTSASNVGQPPPIGTIAVYVKSQKRSLQKFEFTLIPGLLQNVHFETAVTILFDGDLQPVFNAAHRLQGDRRFWPLQFVDVSKLLAPSQEEVSMLSGADVRMRASGMPLRKLYAFWTVHVHALPELSRYRYLWRLEVDSNITLSVTTNLYDVMIAQESLVGYLTLQKARKEACLGLQDATQEFVKNDPDFQPVSSEAEIFLQSFEQRNCPHWRSNFLLIDLHYLRASKPYKDYVRYIDLTVHGFVKYRWATHLVQTLAMLLQVPPQRTLCMRPWVPGYANPARDTMCQSGLAEPALVEPSEL